MNNNAPFAARSNSTHRSPDRTTLTNSEGNESLPQANNRRPVRTERPISIGDIPPQTTNDTTIIIPTPLKIKIEPLDEVEIDETIPQLETQQQNEMDELKIQQNIASLVPEFSGDEIDAIKTANDLLKFIGIADSIYNRLRTNEEKEYFSDIIRYRLTGTAFTRINRRQIKDYKTLKTTLRKMYSRTFSLNELEKNYTGIRQQYGEPTRKYGYRLSEALEQYKAGYKTKYELIKLDDAYIRHLDTNSVETFKRGLTNTILKGKMVTSNAKDLDEIIDETERVEKMLLLTNIEPVQYSIPQPPQLYNSKLDTTKNEQRLVTCNFCQKPNHTWDICRTRMIMESRTPNRRIYQPRSYQQTYPQPNQYSQIRMQNNPQAGYGEQEMTNYTYGPYNPNRQPDRNCYPPQQQQYNSTHQRHHNDHTTRAPPQQNYTQNYRPSNSPNYQQPSHFQQDRPPKYCSYCKITKGHTFEECKNKFRGNRNYDTPNNNQPHPSTDMKSIEEQMSKIRINAIYPDSQHTYHRQNRNDLEQGNATGSDQL